MNFELLELCKNLQIIKFSTCSSWMVNGEERGEGSDEEVRANKLISSWAYTAKPADSSVECLAVYKEGETSATISFVVMEEQLVTLSNIEDKTKVEEDYLLNNNQDKLKDEKTDVELKKVEVKKEAEPLVADADAVQPDADAVDKIARFAAAPKEHFFEGRKHFSW